MRRSVLNMIGVFVLLAGTGCAGFIFLNASGVPRVESIEEDSPLSPLDSRRDSRDLEVYGGKAGLLLERWKNTGRELGKSRSFAIVIAVASISGAMLCFKVESRE